jgi:hypothetical protein
MVISAFSRLEKKADTNYYFFERKGPDTIKLEASKMQAGANPTTVSIF